MHLLTVVRGNKISGADSSFAAVYTVIVKEPLVVVMPSDHRLASQSAIALKDIAGEMFIGMSNTAPTLHGKLTGVSR